jgi:hypothetical protein
MKVAIFTLILAVMFTGAPQAQSGSASNTPSQTGKDSSLRPDIKQVIRAFLIALYSADAAEYQKWILPEAGSNDLLSFRKPTGSELDDLRKEAASTSLQQVSPFVFEGNELTTTTDRRYPIGTKTTFMTGFRGTVIAIPMVYAESGWKVDVRFWVAMKKQADGATFKQTDPEVVAKAFLYYLLARQPQKLKQLSAIDINAEDYTKANNLPGGDLDQILSLCIEMPVIRAREGESFRMPSGEIVKAAKESDTLVLVGLLGTAEIAFQVKKVGDQWKVIPQKYFEMLRRAGAI